MDEQTKEIVALLDGKSAEFKGLVIRFIKSWLKVKKD